MIQSITDTLERSYNASKEYAPVVVMATIMLFSVVAAGGLYTQPVGENQHGSVQAQSTEHYTVFSESNGGITVVNETGTEVMTKSLYSEPPLVAISETQGIVVTRGQSDRDIRAFDIETGNELWNIPQSDTGVYDSGGKSLEINEDSGVAYVSGIGTALAVDVESGNEVWETPISGSVLASYGYNDDGYIYYTGSDGDVYKLDESDGSIVWNTPVSIARQGLYAGGNVYIASDPGVTVLDAETGDTVDTISTSGRLSTVTYSRSSDRYFAGSYLDNYLREFFPSDNTFGSDLITESVLSSGSAGEYIYYTGFETDGKRVTISDGSTETVTVGSYEIVDSSDGSLIEPDYEFSSNLEIDTRNYLEHNQSSPYSVYYTYPSNGTVQDVSDSDALTVNSSNTSVFTLNEQDNLVVATNDTSINQREQFTAEYEGLQAQENVTVANQTVENLPILPGITRVGAVYSDSNIALILVGTLLGVVATRVASAFAGLGAIQLTLVAGWFVDLVSLGVVIVSLFAALFIGLNMAANIDYTVRR